MKRSYLWVMLGAVLSAGLFFLGVASAQPTPLQQGGCGDNRCDPPEDCRTCPRDCGECCGNNRCEPPEDCHTCPRDCGNC